MYEVVDHIANTSGFTYSLELGANVGLENKAVWDAYVKVHRHKDTDLG